MTEQNNNLPPEGIDGKLHISPALFFSLVGVIWLVAKIYDLLTVTPEAKSEPFFIVALAALAIVTLIHEL